MKKLIYTFIGVAVLATFMNSCRGSNATPTESQTVIRSDSSEFTGRVSINIYDKFGARVSDAKVRIYSNYDDIARELFIFELDQGSNGTYDFGYMMVGNYYVEARRGTDYGQGAFQCYSNRTINKNVWLSLTQ